MITELIASSFLNHPMATSRKCSVQSTNTGPPSQPMHHSTRSSCKEPYVEPAPSLSVADTQSHIPSSSHSHSNTSSHSEPHSAPPPATLPVPERPSTPLQVAPPSGLQTTFHVHGEYILHVWYLTFFNI